MAKKKNVTIRRYFATDEAFIYYLRVEANLTGYAPFRIRLFWPDTERTADRAKLPEKVIVAISLRVREMLYGPWRLEMRRIVSIPSGRQLIVLLTHDPRSLITMPEQKKPYVQEAS